MLISALLQPISLLLQFFVILVGKSKVNWHDQEGRAVQSLKGINC